MAVWLLVFFPPLLLVVVVVVVVVVVFTPPLPSPSFLQVGLLHRNLLKSGVKETWVASTTSSSSYTTLRSSRRQCL